MTPTPKTNTEIPTTQTFAYWMGKVDSNLTEMRQAIEAMSVRDAEHRKDLAAWRNAVDRQLEKGNARFDEFQRRILELEEARFEDYQAEHPQPVQRAKSEEDEKPRFGSWPWFRDNYLDKAVFALASILIYKIIELVILSWKP